MNDRWILPEPRLVIEVGMNDGTLAYVRRHGNPKGTRVILTHGSGLSADLYYPYWSLLASKFNLFIYDLRNHGWNPVGDRSRHNIPISSKIWETLPGY